MGDEGRESKPRAAYENGPLPYFDPEFEPFG